MENPSLLMRSTLQTIAGKAIRDLKYGGKRETRNVIELCRGFACRPSQLDFWNRVKSYTTASDSHYDPLIHRAAASVREESLQTLTVNLCCGALTIGANVLRENSDNQKICWIQKIDIAAEPDIIGWNERGAYVFLLDVHTKNDAREPIGSLAGRNSRSIFVLTIREKKPDMNWVRYAAQFDNICFLLSTEALSAVGDLLVECGSFFGALREYPDMKNVRTEKENIARWIQAGCLVGVYDTPKNMDVSLAEQQYQKLVSVRKQGSFELLLCDLQRDTAFVQQMLLRNLVDDTDLFLNKST
ncbi:MAG: hypothetical protein ACOX6P_04690 [Candidatus Merdivicinus sp.]|jgi:hypothetical protein